MTTELVCICCPLGCNLIADEQNGKIQVTGNACKRGAEYAVTELTAPTRTVTSSVKVDGSKHIHRVPVKTSRPIAKDKIFAALLTIKRARVVAPICIGDVIVKDIAENTDVIATRNVPADLRAGEQ